MVDRWTIKQSRKGEEEFSVFEAEKKKVIEVRKKYEFWQRMRKT